MGTRSHFDLRIFNVSDGLDIPIKELIDPLIWKDAAARPNRNIQRNKAIVLMRLEPHEDRNANAKNTYKIIAETFNVTPERVRQIVAGIARKLEIKHRIQFGLDTHWRLMQ